MPSTSTGGGRKSPKQAAAPQPDLFGAAAPAAAPVVAPSRPAPQAVAQARPVPPLPIARRVSVADLDDPDLVDLVHDLDERQCVVLLKALGGRFGGRLRGDSPLARAVRGLLGEE